MFGSVAIGIGISPVFLGNQDDSGGMPMNGPYLLADGTDILLADGTPMLLA